MIHPIKVNYRKYFSFYLLSSKTETIKNQETANRSPIVSPHIVTSPMVKSLLIKCSFHSFIFFFFFFGIQPLDRRDSDKCSLYLPQLSPEHKFTADDLSDISTEDLSQQRPLTKKRVSFNEELTFIPSDEEHEVAEKMDEGVVIKELLFALNHTPVEKKPTFVPQQIITSPKVQPLIQKNQTLPLNSKRESTLEKKRETKKEPQKLSNRLLDMFQPKKPKSQIDLNNIQPTQELNHVKTHTYTYIYTRDCKTYFFSLC